MRFVLCKTFCFTLNHCVSFRVFWLLVVVGALCGLSMQLVKSTSKFVERGTNTKLSYEQMDELDFPSVTICNTNMFRLVECSLLILKKIFVSHITSRDVFAIAALSKFVYTSYCYSLF